MSDIKDTATREAVLPALREDLIRTAVRFLTHPNVVPRPLDQKKSFLISKGLTEAEMQQAILRSTARIPTQEETHMPVAVPMSPSQYQLAPYMSPIEKLRKFLHTLVLLGGLGYGLFWLYKTYIEPFLFGKKDSPKRPIEDRLSDLENTVRTSLAEIRVEMEELEKSTSEVNLAHKKLATFQQIKDLQGDLSSVKGLLLSRQQFPPVPSVTPLKSPVSIPSWQLSEPSEDTENKTENKSEDAM